MLTEKKREQTLIRYRAFKKKNPDRWKEINKEAGRKYRAKNKDKIRARAKVFIEIRAGRLVKEKCHCGSIKVQAHHDDYTMPLDIMWFCAKHHREHERSYPHLLKNHHH